MKPLLCLLIAVAAAACTAPPEAVAVPECAALPTLPAGATPAQRHRHHETVIHLYAECARSRQ